MNFLKPHLLILISFTVWLFFFLTIPTEYLYKGSAIFPVITLISYIGFFFIGLKTIKKTKRTLIGTTETGIKKIKQLTYFLFLIGAVGVLIKLFIGFFITKIFVASNVFEKRLELMDQELSSGIYGAIAALLFPFAVITMFIVIYYRKNFNKIFVVIALIFGIFPIFETFYLGGRTIFVLLGGMIAFIILFYIQNNIQFNKTVYKLKKIKLITIPKFLVKKRVIILLILLIIGFRYYSVNIVTQRLDRFGYKDTLGHWEELHRVNIDDNFQNYVIKLPKDQKDYQIGIYSFKHYFVHGVFEYIRSVNHLEKQTGYYYGSYTFYTFFKFFKLLGIPIKSLTEMDKVAHEVAVFTTFWGPFYLDFGIFGLPIMFLWGRFVKRAYLKAINGDIFFVILYSYLAVILITSFFLNFMLGSSSYYLFAILVAIFIKNLSSKQKSIIK